MVSVDRSRCLVGVREPALKLVTRQASGGTASRRTVVMVGQERANHVEEAADFQKHICSVSPTSSQAPSQAAQRSIATGSISSVIIGS